MIYTVVPARNEGNRIGQTLKMLLSTHTDKIIVILNGCHDDSLHVVESFHDEKIDFVYISKPLGIDVPRAIGAWIAYMDGADGVVFVDGDMVGNLRAHINEIIDALKNKGVDMALTNCYPRRMVKSTMARMLLSFRKQLNQELHIHKKIGFATPSHGPHGISKKCIKKISITSLCIPPVSLALAVKNALKVEVATAIPYKLLRSAVRDDHHADLIAKTMIGDCIEALQVYTGKERTRGYDGITFTGYHKNRRFDLLETFINLDWSKDL